MSPRNDPLAEIMAERLEAPRDVEAREMLAVVRQRMFSRSASLGLGRYRKLERIGEGGMGIVYAAQDPRLRRRVALKVLRSRSRDDGLTVLREARSLARLSHPNVVQVLDAGVEDGETFVAMELVPGSTLAQWLSSTRREGAAIVAAFIQAGRGLAAVHRRSLVHRDFKPSNAIVADDGRVLVTDFGLALPLAFMDGSDATPTANGRPPTDDATGRSAAMVGTLGYAAPEQLRRAGSARVDARADQFALCASLYEALHGAPPFDTASPAQYEASIETASLVRAVNGRRVPPHLLRVIARGLAFDPHRRFANMDALVGALSRAAAPRRRWHLAGATVMLATLVGGGLAASPDARDCPATSEVSAHWDDQARTRARRAFLATGLEYASTAFETVDGDLSGYAEEWTAAYSRACARGDQQHLACLGTGKAGFAAVAQAFTEADATTVEHAHRSMSSLDTIDECAGALTRPPADPDRQAAQDDLAVARVLVAMGDYPAAARALEAPAVLAEQTAEDQLVSDVSGEQGRVAHHLGDLDAAAQHTDTAYYAALAVGDDKAAALHASFLAVIAGVSKRQPEQGGRWARHARAALRRWGGGDPDEAYVHLRLAALARAGGAFEQAREHALRAVACLEDADPPQPAAMSDALTGLGVVLSDLGEHREAIEFLDRSQSMLAQVLPAGHPRFIEGLLSLGVNHISRGALREAETAWSEALRLTEGLGEHHYKVGFVAANLGDVVQRLGRYDEATTHLQRALEILEASLGPQHPALLQPLFSLHDIHMARGETAEAAALIERAQGVAASTPPDGPAQAAIVGSLAELAWRNGAIEEARTHFANAVEMSTRNAGPDGFAGAGTRANYGEFLRQQGDLGAAREQLEHAIAVVEKVRGRDYPDLAHALTSLGRVLAEVGDAAEALDMLRRARQLRSDARTPRWVRAQTELALADALWTAAEPGRARGHAKAALEMCRDDEPAAQECLKRAQQWVTEHRRA